MEKNIKKIEQNKLLSLSILLLVSIALYSFGANISDYNSLVSASRGWLIIIIGIYITNITVAWFFADSWSISMIRMLIGGVFAYICISELVDIAGAAWTDWPQLLGASGDLAAKHLTALRFTIGAWVVSLSLMIVSIAIGFEEEE